MANYLPVLLVSVTTNSIPDDSSVSTLPRAQVDYLSHEWQEEDVWKSWRNMTKQKNEIANGIRLENASWRTWWKQRNKLKTVTPETLNWLKDSDVTWLYGPLHTAVDWAPPPRPSPDAIVDTLSHPNSPQRSALEIDAVLTIPKHKPILKHRSISELLTSDLPASPLFSPAESEDEESGTPLLVQQDPTTMNVLEDSLGTDSTVAASAPLSRPRLMHTKSDTHVTRWGPSRAFRKASPPRIDPSDVNSGLAADIEAASMTSPSATGSSVPGSHVEGSDSPLGHSCNVSGSGSHLMNVYASSNPRYDEPQSAISTSSTIVYSGVKKKHISFNTFVEQCIAIDKPKSESPRPLERPGSLYGYGGHGWEYDEGYDEDDEDGYSGACAIESDSDSEYDPNERHPYNDMNESAIDDEDGDDDILHMRTPSSPKYNPSRSKSKSSTRSSTSVDTSASTSTSVSNSTASTSSSSSSSSTSRRIHRRNSAPTRRRASFGLPTGAALGPHPHTAVPMNRATSDSSTTSGPSESALVKEREHPVHVTIAPIAPTFLKTSGLGEEEDGDTDYPWNGFSGFDQEFGYGYDPFGWGSIHGGRVSGGGEKIEERESGYTSAGAWYGRGSGVQKDQKSKGGSQPYIPRAVRAETPVELVYVPRLGSGYNSRYESPEIVPNREDADSTNLPSPRRRAHFSIGEPDDLAEPDDHPPPEQIGRVTVTPASPTHSPASSITLVRALDGSAVVTTPPAIQMGGGDGVEGGDPYDYFGGPDLGEDFSSTTSGGRRRTRKPPPKTTISPPEEEERGRGRERSRSRSRSNSRSQSGSVSLSVSRSRSRSRTPSPTFISSTNPSPSSTSPEQIPGGDVKESSPGVSPLSLPPKRASSFDVVMGGGYQPSSAMLSPPMRGRSVATLGGGEARGRSTTRTPSSSFSDRDRASCHSSPLGSSSPEGSTIGLAGYGIYANGRVEKERELARERERGGGMERQQRGRPRLGRSLSSSTSVSPVDYSGRDVISPSLVAAALASGPASPPCSDKSLEGVEPSNSPSALGRSPRSSTSSSSSSTITTASVDTTSCVPAAKDLPSSGTVSVPTTLPSTSPPEASCAKTSSRDEQASPSRVVMVKGEEGQVHEVGTTLGRAAGVLSSYLGLWPATGAS